MKNGSRACCVVLSWLMLAAGHVSGASAAQPLPENLALKAKVSASDEYNGQYVARNAVDGLIPLALCQQDTDAAWVVRGAASKFSGWFALQWDVPGEVAQIVYYGRTAMVLEECFKDYEVYLDDAAEPVVRGALKMTG